MEVRENFVETVLSPSTFMWVSEVKLRLSGLYSKYFYLLVCGYPLSQVTTMVVGVSSAVPPCKRIVPAGLVDCLHLLMEGWACNPPYHLYATLP